MDDTKLAAIVDAVVRELKAAGVVQPASSSAPQPDSTSQASASSSVVPVKPRASTSSGSLSIDLPDPTTPEARLIPYVDHPKDAACDFGLHGEEIELVQQFLVNITIECILRDGVIALKEE